MSDLPALSAGKAQAAIESSKDVSRLAKLKSLSLQDVKDEKALEKATAGFEALLLHQMIKAMWETVDGTGLLGEESNQAEIYRDMFNQAVADSVASGTGIGVKGFLRQELLKRYTASKL